MKTFLFCSVLVMSPTSLWAEPLSGTDPLSYPGPAWSPYLVGALIGILSWFTFYFSNEAIGASSAYATVAGMLGKLFAPRHTESLQYFKDDSPKVDWGLMMVGGIILGSFLSAWSGGALVNQLLPPMWQARFGSDSYLLRAGVAFAGGLLMAFGARLAGGCTSGHGISGTLQLSVGSWISAMCFFIGGIAVAMLLY